MTTAATATATPTTPATALPPFPAGALALSPEQVAQALGITRTKTYALLASKRIRSVKLGRYRRIPVAEVEAFLQREMEAQGA